MPKDNHNFGPEDFPEAINSYFEHVQTHDLEKVQGAISFIAHKSDKKGAFHVCALRIGSPQFLAEMMVKAIDSMIEDVPGFDEMFKKACQMREAEGTIQELVDKLKASGININMHTASTPEEMMNIIKGMQNKAEASKEVPEPTEEQMKSMSEKVTSIFSKLNKKDLH